MMRIVMRGIALSVASITFVIGAGCAQHKTGESKSVVDELVVAFNAHDPEGMGAFMTEDVELYYIDGGKIEPGAIGQEALKSSMQGYFRGVENAQSRSVDSTSLGEWVASFEEASWGPDDARRSARSLSVYQLRDGKIARVWYFPTVAEAPPQE